MFTQGIRCCVLTLFVGCGIAQSPPKTKTENICHELKIQSEKWDEANARTLMACIVRESKWSERILSLEVEHFAETAQWLNDREKLAQSISRFQDLDPKWGIVLREARSHYLLNHGNLVDLFRFSAEIQEHWSEHFAEFETDYERLLKEIFSLDVNQGDHLRLLRSMATIFEDLPLKTPVKEWDHKLFRLMRLLSGKTELQGAFARVAPHVKCQNLAEPHKFEVRTTSPLELGVELFRNPKVDPAAFVERFEQGYLFWQSACNSTPAINRADVKNLLIFGLDHFELLRSIAELGWTQSSVVAFGDIFILNQSVQQKSAETVGFLEILANSPALESFFSRIAEEPERAKVLLDLLPREAIAYDVFASVARHPNLGGDGLFLLWKNSWNLLSVFAPRDKLLQEWQRMLSQLGPEATAAFGAAIEDGSFQRSMSYLSFLLNTKPGTPSVTKQVQAPERRRPMEEISDKKSYDPRTATPRRWIDLCLSPTMQLEDSLRCLKNHGAKAFPESARWVSHFTADWKVLYLLRNLPMEFLLSPKTAEEFWHPLINGFHLPVRDADGVMAWLASGHKLSAEDQTLIMALGQRLFMALTQTDDQRNPGSQRALNPKLFNIQSSINKLDPQYFSDLIFSLLGDPNYLETRRSFFRLAKTKITVGPETDSPVYLLTAINELFSNFKIPFFSRSRGLELALSSTNELKNASELVLWMGSTEEKLQKLDSALDLIFFRADTEPRKSLRLARETLHGLRSSGSAQDLWNIFSWIRDFRHKGGDRIEQAQFLLMLHELGFISSIQDLYDDPPQWLVQGIRNQTPEESENLRLTSQWVAETLLAVFRRLNAKELYDLAVLNQVSTNGKFLSWAIVELGALIMSPEFRVSSRAQSWLQEGIRRLGPPPLKSPEVLTPLLIYVRQNKSDFMKLFRPETLELAAALRAWSAYPEFNSFLTSRHALREWKDLVHWLKSGVPLQLWLWSLRMERRSLDPIDESGSATMKP